MASLRPSLPGDLLCWRCIDGDSTCSAVEVFTVAEAAQMCRLFLVASCSGMRRRGRRQRDRHFVAGNVMATSYQLNGEPAEHRRQLSMGLAAGEYFR